MMLMFLWLLNYCLLFFSLFFLRGDKSYFLNFVEIETGDATINFSHIC